VEKSKIPEQCLEMLIEPSEEDAETDSDEE